MVVEALSRATSLGARCSTRAASISSASGWNTQNFLKSSGISGIFVLEMSDCLRDNLSERGSLAEQQTCPLAYPCEANTIRSEIMWLFRREDRSEEHTSELQSR